MAIKLGLGLPSDSESKEYVHVEPVLWGIWIAFLLMRVLSLQAASIPHVTHCVLQLLLDNPRLKLELRTA